MPLVVCATPIGNLDDVTLRVLATLRDADVVLCEDTRHTRRLLERHGIRPARLVSHHRHNEAAREAELLALLAEGRTVALVSDAGMPGIADPGLRAVAAAAAAGHGVTVLPGPSAVEAALVASGLGSDEHGYRFLGWLPRREAERARLWAEVAAAPWPVVAFDSPQRVGASLASLAAVEPGRPVAVCRELTKRFEEVVRGSAAEVASRLEGGVRGEVTVVIGAGGGMGRDPAADAAQAEAVAAVAELVAAGIPRRQAAELVARLARRPARALYRASLG